MSIWGVDRMDSCQPGALLGGKGSVEDVVFVFSNLRRAFWATSGYLFPVFRINWV